VATIWATFGIVWATLKKFGQLFIPTSGHAVYLEAQSERIVHSLWTSRRRKATQQQ